MVCIVTARPDPGGARRAPAFLVRAGGRDLRWVHIAAVAMSTVLISSCNSQASRSEALDNAEPEARARVQEYQTAASGLLQRPNTVASVERALADGNPAVFDSRSAGRRITWDLVVVGEGSSGGGVGQLTQGVRACVRLTGVLGQVDVAVTDTTCPSGREADRVLPAYSETRRLYD